MKLKRHFKIIELISERDIETQEELGEGLKRAGFHVTQATISRDIKELGLIKINTAHGKQKYAVLSSMENQLSDRMVRVFCEGVISIEIAMNIIVIKTLEGMAMGIGAAMDAMNLNGIVGTIAGDDTLFSVTKNEQTAMEAALKLKSIIKQ